LPFAFWKKEARNHIGWKRILWFPVIGMLIVYFVFFFAEFCLIVTGRLIILPFISELTYEKRIEIILTLAIAMFAGIEGYSAYFLYISDKQKIIAEELEKVYGPLYSIVSKPGRAGDSNRGESGFVIDLTLKERERLDEIVTTYPHMLPYEIIVEWRIKIRDRELRHVVTEKFKDRILEEYEKRLMDYYEMAGRKKEAEEIKKKPKIARV